MTVRAWGRRGWIVLLFVVLGGPLAVPAVPASGLTLCPTAGPGPSDPHPGPAVPFIGGIITDGNGAPIAGASVMLDQCVLGVPLPAGLQITGSDGRFEFDVLTASAEYVVYTPLEGVLAGLVPASGTLNPSWIIKGADGDDHVDMAFE